MPFRRPVCASNQYGQMAKNADPVPLAKITCAQRAGIEDFRSIAIPGRGEPV